MTDLKIVYDSLQKNVELYIENKLIISLDNKVNMFLQTTDFYQCLRPYRRRYVIWNGLLIELMIEFNDDELNITFVGKTEEFKQVEEAFQESKIMVEKEGYENHWKLNHIQKFEIENFCESFIEIADEIKEMCETRNELLEIRAYSKNMSTQSVEENYQQLEQLIQKHINKWESSQEIFKDSKINLLKLQRKNLSKIKKYLNIEMDGE